MPAKAGKGAGGRGTPACFCETAGRKSVSSERGIHRMKVTPQRFEPSPGLKRRLRNGIDSSTTYPKGVTLPQEFQTVSQEVSLPPPFTVNNPSACTPIGFTLNTKARR